VDFCKQIFRVAWRSATAFVPIFACVLFTACSLNLAKIDSMEHLPKVGSDSFFKSVTLLYAGETIALDSSVVAAYSSAIDSTLYSKNCSGEAKIYANVTPTDSSKSAWVVGAAFIPLWPALPVNEIWNFELKASIACDGFTARKIDIVEHEQVEAFFYGVYRVDLINDAASAMHKKLIRRLQEDLTPQQPMDFNNI